MNNARSNDATKCRVSPVGAATIATRPILLDRARAKSSLLESADRSAKDLGVTQGAPRAHIRTVRSPLLSSPSSRKTFIDEGCFGGAETSKPQAAKVQGFELSQKAATTKRSESHASNSCARFRRTSVAFPRRAHLARFGKRIVSQSAGAKQIMSTRWSSRVLSHQVAFCLPGKCREFQQKGQFARATAQWIRLFVLSANMACPPGPCRELSCRESSQGH